MSFFFFLIFLVLVVCLNNVESQVCNSISGSGYLYSTGTTLTTKPAVYANFPLLANPLEYHTTAGLLGYRSVTLPINTWTNVSYLSTGIGGGVIRKLWISLNGPGTNAGSDIASLVFISINFDNAAVPQVGTQAATPGVVANNALTIETLFTPGWGSNITTNSEAFGCNNIGQNSSGCYITFDMPFRTNFTIYLYNSALGSVTYSVQTEYELFHSSYIITPLYFHLQIGVSIGLAYPNEYPILSLNSTNGVFLKRFIWFFGGISGNWWEGRFRIYTGGPGLTTTISGTHYTDGTYTTSTPYDPAAQVIWTSTATSDFFGSSSNFLNSPYYAYNHAGYLYNSAGPMNALVTGSSWTAYKQFGTSTSKSSVLPNSLPNQYLVFTWTAGDPAGAGTGQANYFVYSVAYYS